MIDLEDALLTWRRTVRRGQIVHRAGSAEGRFRPALGEIELLDEPPFPVMPLDIRLGWTVERCWRYLPSAPHKIILSAMYVHNRSLEEAARRAKIAHRDRQEALALARHSLQLSIDKTRFAYLQSSSTI